MNFGIQLNKSKKVVLPPISEIFKMIRSEIPKLQGIRKQRKASLGYPVHLKLPRIQNRQLPEGYSYIKGPSRIISSRAPPKKKAEKIDLIKNINKLIDKHDGYLCYEYNLKISDPKLKIPMSKIGFRCYGKSLEMNDKENISLKAIHKSMSLLHGINNLSTRPNHSKMTKTFKLVVGIKGREYESKGFFLYSFRGIQKVMYKKLKPQKKKYKHLKPTKFEDKYLVYSK